MDSIARCFSVATTSHLQYVNYLSVRFIVMISPSLRLSNACITLYISISNFHIYWDSFHWMLSTHNYFTSSELFLWIFDPKPWPLHHSVNWWFSGYITIILLPLWAGYLSRYSDWLRAGRSGIESRWGRDFPTVQTGPGAHSAFCKMGTGSFSGVKCCRGVLLTTHPLLVPRSWKSRAMPLPTLRVHTGLVTGSLFLTSTTYVVLDGGH